MTFTDLPKILVLHVNRSNYDKDKREHIKINAQINCNKVISLPLGSNGPIVEYRLSSVIHHTGTPDSGHYTATLCDPATKRMWLCNDTNITPTANVNQATAGILFYKKVE